MDSAPPAITEPPKKDDSTREKEKKTLRELSILCTKGNGSVPAKTFAEFLRARVHNEEAAAEVEQLVLHITQASREVGENMSLSEHDGRELVQITSSDPGRQLRILRNLFGCSRRCS